MPFDFAPDPSETAHGRKRRRGRVAYLRGHAAEEQVARHYTRQGARLLHQRWRGGAGEIDLIFDHGAELICVEVKASGTHAAAARSLRPRQLARLCCAAEEFLGTQPQGSLTPMRFDVALVDGQGAIEILQNAVMAV